MAGHPGISVHRQVINKHPRSGERVFYQWFNLLPFAAGQPATNARHVDARLPLVGLKAQLLQKFQQGIVSNGRHAATSDGVAFRVRQLPQQPVRFAFHERRWAMIFSLSRRA